MYRQQVKSRRTATIDIASRQKLLANTRTQSEQKIIPYCGTVYLLFVGAEIFGVAALVK